MTDFNDLLSLLAQRLNPYSSDPTPAAAAEQPPHRTQDAAFGDKSALRDVGTGIPLDPDSTPTPPTSIRDDLLAALSGTANFGAGVAERANKGLLNALGFRTPEGDIHRSTIPIDEGLRMLEGGGTFATGGLASSLFPAAGALRAGMGAVAPVVRETAAGIPAFLADETGARSLLPGRNYEPKFPQYAEEYPPVGPPTIKINEKGNEFPAKLLTPEAEAFAKERRRIQTDMNKNGYEPYFDPADRSYVDPSNYPPPNVDTSTLIPTRQSTIDQYMQIIGAPETRKALQDAYARGTELGNADHWYAMAQLEKKYIDVHGPEAGRKAFLDEFAAPMAATTSGNDPTFNLMMAHYLEYLRKRGEPMPVSDQLPYPVGGRFAGNNLEDYEKMRQGGGYAALGATTPKMHNFSRSFLGDLSQPVMDDQMARGMLAHASPDFIKNARKTAYGLLEGPVHEEAAALGIAPGNVQDVGWAGFKDEPGKPMISILNEAIERTHRLTGMPKEEIVVRGLIKKEIPIYGLLGAIGLGAVGGNNQ